MLLICLPGCALRGAFAGCRRCAPEAALQIIDGAARIAAIALRQAHTVSDMTQSEANHCSVLDHLHDGVFVTQQGLVVYANPAVTTLLGYSGPALLNSDFYALVCPEDAARLRGCAAMRDGGVEAPRECVVCMTRVDGEARTMRISHAAITWNDAPALLSTLADITERERAQREVERLNIELEQRVEERTRALAAANRDLEAFNYSVSHDLRAPVRAINGFSSILLKKYASTLEVEVRQHLERVHNAGRRMDEMIEGLLALSRIARGATLRAEALDISALARSVLVQLREAHPARNVDCEIAADVRASGDRRLLHTALDNLLGNAWKFTGKVAAARIAFGAVERDGETVYFVRDNGAGFDMRYAQKLFGVFQRLHSSEAFEGAGVGLATVQRIITGHGGRIWAESEPGRGATFFFTLAQPPAP